MANPASATVTSTASIKLRRAWESAQKVAKKLGEPRILVEVWQLQGPLHARVTEPKIVQRYPLDAEEEGEGLVEEWLDTIRITGEAFGGNNLFEVSFMVRDEHQAAVKVPLSLPMQVLSPSPMGGQAAPPAAPAIAYPSQSDMVVQGLAGQLTSTMSMLMKHYENTLTLMNKSQEQVMGSLVRQLELQGRRIESLEVERTTLILSHEETLTLKEERVVMAEKAKKDEARKDELWSNGIVLGTALLKNWASGQLDGAAIRDTTNNFALKKFVESLSKPQFDAMMTHLDPSQQMLIIELISGAQDELETKKP